VCVIMHAKKIRVLKVSFFGLFCDRRRRRDDLIEGKLPLAVGIF